MVAGRRAGPVVRRPQLAGATTTGTVWALADGEVGGSNGASTYILVANTGAAPASVRVTVYVEGGGTAVAHLHGAGVEPLQRGRRRRVFGSHGRRTRASARWSRAWARRPAPIVVERAIYTNAGGRVWAAGTNALATRIQ